MEQQEQEGSSRGLTWTGGALLVLLVSLPFAIPAAQDWMAKNKAKASAASELLDPSSAQFRSVHVVRTIIGRDVCGEINGKNVYGAYVGFKRFAASDKTDAIIEPEPTSQSDAFSDLRRLTWSSASEKCKW